MLLKNQNLPWPSDVLLAMLRFLVFKFTFRILYNLSVKHISLILESSAWPPSSKWVFVPYFLKYMLIVYRLLGVVGFRPPQNYVRDVFLDVIFLFS